MLAASSFLQQSWYVSYESLVSFLKILAFNAMTPIPETETRF